MDTILDFLSTPTRRRPAVIGIGVFDGVHRAHRLLINTVRQRANERGVSAGILTFEPHPQEILTGSPPSRLSGIDEKVAQIALSGIDFIAVIEFTREFSRLSPEEFALRVLVERLAVREVVIGFNFHFGRGGAGTPALLAELGQRHSFTVRVIGPVSDSETPVSSSAIRNALAAGALDEATRLLERPYALRGTVQSGAGRGRLLGFPTANLNLEPPSLMLPRRGVYVGTARLVDGSTYPALVNVGTRPTFEDSERLVVEVHLQGFVGHLAGQKLVVDFVERLRDEKRFSSVEELIAQLEADRERLVAPRRSEVTDSLVRAPGKRDGRRGSSSPRLSQAPIR